MKTFQKGSDVRPPNGIQAPHRRRGGNYTYGDDSWHPIHVSKCCVNLVDMIFWGFYGSRKGKYLAVSKGKEYMQGKSGDMGGQARVPPRSCPCTFYFYIYSYRIVCHNWQVLVFPCSKHNSDEPTFTYTHKSGYK